MKKAQRAFVVEIKTNRRQPKSSAKSIWGDTDFKTLARAVADDPSPFDTRATQAGQGRAQAEPQPPATAVQTAGTASPAARPLRPDILQPREIAPPPEKTSLDELVALEAENRRLKRLLAEKLHFQNRELKRMLERFGATS